MLYLFMLSIISFCSFLFTFLSNQKHFLMLLLCLEGMMLTLVMLIPSSNLMSSLSIPTISLLLLTFGACEASLGLGLLVKMSRQYGSDKLSNLNINKC